MQLDATAARLLGREVLSGDELQRLLGPCEPILHVFDAPDARVALAA